MSYRYGDSINKDGINKTDFQAKLNSNKKLSDKDKQKVMDIFTKFAQKNGFENILDEKEQIEARAAFAAIDADQDGEVTNKEFKTGAILDNKLSQTFFDNGKKASEIFMNIFDSVVGSKDKKQTGEVQFGHSTVNSGNFSIPTVYYDQSTQDPNDDKLTTYTMTQHGTIDKDKTREVTGRHPSNKPDGSGNPGGAGNPEKITDENITKAFFQYLTGNKDFNGSLKNNSQMIFKLSVVQKML